MRVAGEAHYVVDESDFVAAHRAAYRLLLRWPFLRIVLGTALIGAAIMGLAAWLGTRDPASVIFEGVATAAVILGLFGLIVLLNLRVLPGRARRLFAQSKLIRYPETATWSDRHISFPSERGTMTTPWSDYHRWADSHGVFLLYVSDMSFHLVPQRSFAPEALADLRATLVEHGPPRR